ncbi:hypothetical protein SCUCBS95973_009450 [Sporothrix curviconia]|uniref:Alpha-L-rhamnosidase six-hairpin glycosidase domain-containing protein n=1 Tax=Sporothrix curviconia TaxID=1260050 RepID=A0ABP0CW27_9PEZI
MVLTGVMATTRLVMSLAAIVTQLASFVECASPKCWKETPCDSRYVEAAFKGPWESNILAPASRTVIPGFVVERLETANGDAIPASRLTFDPNMHPLILRGNGSQLVFDFGQEVGGLVTLQYSVGMEDGDDDDSSPSSGKRSLGLAFAESSEFIGQWSDSSNGAFQGSDGAIYADLDDKNDGNDGNDGDGDDSNRNSMPPHSQRTYTMPDAALRGGFRYLTVFLMSEGDYDCSVTLRNITLELAFQPTWPNLRAYQGYFDCDDAVLNRIWYAGAYTLQTNAVPPGTGRRVPFLKTGWANDGLLGPGHTILVDGAKRDRAVWPGDMGVAVPSLFNTDGSFPEAGPPLLQQGSDTYHMWTMIGTYNYVLYTNDTAFLAHNWAGYQHAMAFITAKQADGSPSVALGLLHVTGVRDWARLDVGTNMTEAQVILFQTLSTGAQLAAWQDEEYTETSRVWQAAAERLRSATLKFCYDPQQGLFRDNALSSTTVCPQDANALALALGMTGAGKQINETVGDIDVNCLSENISDHLIRNWMSPTNPYPVIPELPGHISPFISSWEVRGHLVARETDRALDLMRTLWGQYLTRPDGSQSSLVEGLLALPDGKTSFGYRWNRGYGGTNNDTTVAASYTSHSHGWSAGPMSALTEFVLGLSVTGVVGSKWQFAPQVGQGGKVGLGRVEGGFVTPLGKFQAKWACNCCANGSCNDAASSSLFEATVNTPPSTKGVLILPVPGDFDLADDDKALEVTFDGDRVQKFHLKGAGSHKSKNYVVTMYVQGGKHTIKVLRVSK